MSTGSWPLDLFWLLSGATIAFAVIAYFAQRRRRNHGDERNTARLGGKHE